ncbi:MAG: hypothetical protein K0S33_876 [Bacteroidetes bacterium]|jgi:hypothetical protein|nr:hypothetical protein [Bacteroidota bacterium]
MRKTIKILIFLTSVLVIASCSHERSEIELIKLDQAKDITSLFSTADSLVSVPQPDGDTSIHIYYKREHTIIHKQGFTVSVIQKFKDGIKTFVGEYYANGQLKGKIMLNEKGEIDGTVTYYYENGRIKTIGQFKSGRKSGDWKIFDENGYLQKIENF